MTSGVVSRRVTHAGGVVYRLKGSDPEILIVTAKRNPSAWIFPKGHIEPGETLEQTALREVEEESGVVGDLIGPIGKPIEFDTPAEHVRVQYFLIRMTAESPGMEGRAKRWLRVDKADQMLTYDNLRGLLAHVRALSKGHQLDGA